MNSEQTRDRALITVSGRVQGVGYRWAVKTAADAMGVVGVVRNLPGGDVEIIAEAEQEILTAFVGAAHRGSPAGEVRDMTVIWTAGESDWAEFRIVP